MQQKNGGFYDPTAKKGDYRIMLAPCAITGEITKVIVSLLHTVDIEFDDGEKDDFQVWGSFSAEGLAMMQRALDAAPMPVDLPDPDGIRANLKYYWIAVYADGAQVRQWTPSADGGPAVEKHFGHLRPHDVVRFFLIPKDPAAGWPSYCLDRVEGLLIADKPGDDFRHLYDPVTHEKLPLPTCAFHLEYCFRPTITLAAGFGQSELFPVRVRHELGWRVDQCHGDAADTWFLIAVDDDGGDWQIHKKEPLDSRHFETDGDGSNPVLPEGPDDGPKRIEGNVVICDQFAGAGV